MVWYSHLFQNFPQFIVIHTVKGFGIVIIVSYNPLYLYIVCCNLSFSFLILLIRFFSLFFLMSLAKGLSFYLLKKQLLVLLIFTIVSFISFSFISAQIFMISFLLLILGGFFVLLFPVALGVKLGCLFDVFLVS